ncbi:hypothetical protein D047_2538A, partial [Vibrio parahaemolyticus VPTS-2010_2]
MTQSAS